ncbi:MAG TPA: UbiA family prenyltransferase [Allosphingosinicella sp.]|nr:UbiA family prenyltransferase [Allosphingosinicella sp.]
MISSLGIAVRTGQWWEHKLVPIVTAFYATALFRGAAITSLWSEGLIFLLSLLPGAVFVSVVNDLTDIRSDAAAGKANRMAGRSPAFRATALGAALAAGAPFLWHWSDRPILVALYGAAWIAFALYSVPPARLKARGAAGLAADAAGAHLFPTLLAAALVFASDGSAPDAAWMAALAIWSFACGCRGNLWHQLLDRAGDRQAGVRTFAARHSPGVAARTAEAFFTIEAAALVALLLIVGSGLPFLAAAYYLFLAWRRWRCWHLPTVIAGPRAEYRLWLDDYYGVLLPLSLLAASALKHPFDLLVAAVHLALFPRRPAETAADSWFLVLRPLLRRMSPVRPEA